MRRESVFIMNAAEKLTLMWFVAQMSKKSVIFLTNIVMAMTARET